MLVCPTKVRRKRAPVGSRDGGATGAWSRGAAAFAAQIASSAASRASNAAPSDRRFASPAATRASSASRASRSARAWRAAATASCASASRRRRCTPQQAKEHTSKAYSHVASCAEASLSRRCAGQPSGSGSQTPSAAASRRPWRQRTRSASTTLRTTNCVGSSAGFAPALAAHRATGHSRPRRPANQLTAQTRQNVWPHGSDTGSLNTSWHTLHSRSGAGASTHTRPGSRGRRAADDNMPRVGAERAGAQRRYGCDKT